MLKFTVTSLVLPPGLFVVLLCGLSLRLFRRREAWSGFVALLIAAALWAASTGPVSDRLLAGLESAAPIPADPSDGTIVLLGGGVAPGAPDHGGPGTPTAEMTARLVAAARLQKRTGLPLVVTGGSPFPGGAPEAPVVRRFLVDLGVPARKIAVEPESRDTAENAAFTVRLMARDGLPRRAILVTSAFHMRRARFLFEREGVEVLPYPAAFRTWPGKACAWFDWLPSAGGLQGSVLALKEYMGFEWYRLTTRGPEKRGGTT